MRTTIFILFLALVTLQYKLWLGDGNVLQWKNLEKKIAIHELENQKLITINKTLEANILELRQGDQELEEQARYELGMIKQTEKFYQFIN